MAYDVTKGVGSQADAAFKKMQDHFASMSSQLKAISVPQFRMPELPKLPPNPNLASEFYKRLLEWIADFDKDLDDEHEVGVRLVTFGQTVVFHLEGMGYCNPSLISFHGHAQNGDPVELIQHVSQISILLTKMKRQDPTQPKMGFAALMESKKSELASTPEEGSETPPCQMDH
jgi:hypothetical protein